MLNGAVLHDVGRVVCLVLWLDGGGANKKLLYCKYSTGNKDICISHSFVLYTTLTTTVALVVVAILIA